MRIVGGLTGESLESARNADWIILRRHINSPSEIPVRRFAKELLSTSYYKPIIINYPDTAFENRECPERHNYRTVQNEFPVLIFKRIK